MAVILALVTLAALAAQAAVTACGKSSGQRIDHPAKKDYNARIFGGSNAREHEFPTQAYIVSTIFDENRGDQYNIFCGGTIISETWILTAAHCVNKSVSTSVGVGSGYLRNLKLTTGKRVIAHQYYALYSRFQNNAINDVGLIELVQPLELDGHKIAAAQLPTSHQPMNSIKDVRVIGWGRWSYHNNITHPSINQSKKLKKLYVEIIPCPDRNDGIICTKSVVGTGICDGDSGGPLLVNGMVYGVASYVDNSDRNENLNPNYYCNDADTWAVYASVPAYRDWIKNISGI